MKHLDIFIHFICLLSGIITALLGFLLYLKYRIKPILSYSLFIFSTTLTVSFTTFFSYVTYFVYTGSNALYQITGTLIFALFISIINLTFTLFANGIMKKPLTPAKKAIVGLPWLIIFASAVIAAVYNSGKPAIVYPPFLNISFGANLGILFLSFIGYCILIFLNLKKMDNPDLRKALKALALVILIDIPIQTSIIIVTGNPTLIMLGRNLLYLAINIVSVVFAAKYFFIKTPSIMEKIEIGGSFMEKYSLTAREKEIIELLLSGLSIKEISAKLFRSFKTVNNHIYNIYQKTGSGNKMELLNLIKDHSL
ncbi:MAG: helix-turn-helix transcriptional regulator [Brevinematales bacterium]|nr:helix-turn-helix transcriptional regulator [Brevinematales bacterium]